MNTVAHVVRFSMAGREFDKTSEKIQDYIHSFPDHVVKLPFPDPENWEILDAEFVPAGHGTYSYFMITALRVGPEL